MSDPRLRLHAPEPAPRGALPRRPIGRYLRDEGILTARQLITALSLQARQDAPLGAILTAEGMASGADVLQAVALQHGLHVVDLEREPPDPALSRLKPPEFWLRHRVIPWMTLGQTLVVATARPDQMDQLCRHLPQPDARILAVVAPERQILDAIAAAHGPALAARAEQRVPPDFSSRTGFWRPRRSVALLVLAALLAFVIWRPDLMALGVSVLAALTLIPVAALKLTAFVVQLVARQHDPPTGPLPPEAKLPAISVLVPLYRETEIAGALLQRLNRLTYPRALLDVILVLEEHDTVTRAALENAQLPAWIRICKVPDSGALTTKPRAMNYALDFARGDIIGVWDAEDAPVPDQLEQITAHFAAAPPEVVCLQGVLDYYNPRASWISRCFTIEYAGWWRILLPGIARLGLVLPLGGTTLFFRRAALERLGAWDAHNVTEDADLGVRLARFGYRTELVGTVTYEEATCRVWPWVRQRSRWLKGFAMTWLVHMRAPRRMLRDLGWWRFVGVQLLLAGTVAQFALAPVLWSFWLLMLTGLHPASTAGSGMIWTLSLIFGLAELSNLAIGAAGVARPGRRFLMIWVFLLPLYYAMGAAAAAKAAWELLTRPYFWDKTTHGQSGPDVRIWPRARRRHAEAG